MPGIPSKPNNIPLASSLPKVSFRKIPAEEVFFLNVPAGVLDPHMVAFGFNDGSDFEKPEHYIRYLEPIESDLKKQVEYDMDEQDQEWLEVLNAERKKDGLDSISFEIFEIILDQLEKEWFDLMKRVPPKARPGGAAATGDDEEATSDNGEDSKCAICDDGECENSNAIVFCDGCNLAVHQDCYGIPYIPEGQWLCRKCTVSPDRAVSCILCPHEGGAFKQTTTGKWAHLLCAMWIPETGVSNPVYMEPIDSIERIPKARWKLQCYLCRHKVGACIQCDNRSCFTAFHVTCARKAGLLFKTERTRVSHHLYEDSDDSDDEGSDVLRACCHKHMPRDMRDQLRINFATGGAARQGAEEDQSEGSMRDSPHFTPRTREQSIESGVGAPLISISRRSSISGAPNNKRVSKSARAYKKSFRAGPPLVPAYIANRVLEYISKLPLRKKPLAVQLIARYWSLKREARRGAPLLKRLHLEPWTASPQNKEQTDVQKGKKLLFLRTIREDLERVRMLVEQVKKREKEKLRQAQEIRSALVEKLLFPYHDDLRAAIAKFEAVDKHGFFSVPVSRVDVPDYYDIIKEPMDWATIKEKISDRQYDSIQELREDVLKVAANAMTYNKVDTPYHKAASKILKLIPDVFKDLEHLERLHLLHFQAYLEQQQQKQSGTTASSAGEATPLQPEASQTTPSSTVSSISFQVKQQLEDLRLEPPTELVGLLRDYAEMAQEEQEEVRHAAYEDGSPPPIKRMKIEEEQSDNLDLSQPTNKGREKTPILNIMEDLVKPVYVPSRPPTETKKSAKKASPASSVAAGEPTAVPKNRKKRSISATAARTPQPAERRSSRRLHADVDGHDATMSTHPAHDKQSQVNKRRRTQSTTSSASGQGITTIPEDREGDTGTSTEEQNGEKSSASLGPEPVPVKDRVGDHDSFLFFNQGWVFPEGSKRNRNTTFRPEMVGMRPRKISAPESPDASNKASAATTKPLPNETPSRSRARTMPSSNHSIATSSKSASTAEKKENVARSGSKKRKLRTHEGESVENGVGSSPLTSDDEKDAEQGKSEEGKGERKGAEKDPSTMTPNERYNWERREKRAREREAREKAKAEAVAAASATGTAVKQGEASTVNEGHHEVSETPSRRSARSRTTTANDEMSKNTDAADTTKKELSSVSKSNGTGRASLTDRPSFDRSSSKNGTTAEKASSPLLAQDVTDKLAEGTLVWAKMDTFPYFPGEVMNEDEEEEIPRRVLASKPPLPPIPKVSSHSNSVSKQLALPAEEKNDVTIRRSSSRSVSPQGSSLKDHQNLYWVLVRFYDSPRSWQWVPSNKVVLMLEDTEQDLKMLKADKYPHYRKKVKDAYEEAKKNLDV